MQEFIVISFIMFMIVAIMLSPFYWVLKYFGLIGNRKEYKGRFSQNPSDKYPRNPDQMVLWLEQSGVKVDAETRKAIRNLFLEGKLLGHNMSKN